MTQADGGGAEKSPFAYRQYRELWSANAVSNVGSQVQVVSAAWLMATLTSSPQMIALVQTSISLPVVLFILAGGAVADNYDRRAIMLVTQTVMLGFAALLSVLTWLSLISPWSLMGLTFAISACNSLNNPCWQASIRDILPRGQISRAVALNSMSINIARTGGPAIGGLIVTLFGGAVAFAANALSFLGFIVALVRWKPLRKPRSAPREEIVSAMIAGVRYVSLEPNVRNAVVRGGWSGLSASAAFALLPVLARDKLNGEAALYGLLLAAFGVGAVVSAWVGGRMRGRYAPDEVIGLAVVVLTTGLATLAWSPVAAIAGLGAALCGAGWVLAHSTYNTSVQLSAPAWVTARSLALYQTATFAGMAVGSALFGWFAEHFSVSAAFFIASIAQGTTGVGGLFLPLPRLGAVNVEALNTWQEPKPDVELNDGPISIEIEYVVESRHVVAFLSAMRERQRIKQRDGARDWRIKQDIADGARWIEIYCVPTWAEYLRHMNRRTVADVENRALLRSLSVTSIGARVRRYIQRRFD